MLKFIMIMVILTSCTYSVNMIHTEGTASDIVDENQEASPDISPTIPLVQGACEPQNYPPPDPRGMNGPDRKFT